MENRKPCKMKLKPVAIKNSQGDTAAVLLCLKLCNRKLKRRKRCYISSRSIEITIYTPTRDDAKAAPSTRTSSHSLSLINQMKRRRFINLTFLNEMIFFFSRHSRSASVFAHTLIYEINDNNLNCTVESRSGVDNELILKMSFLLLRPSDVL